MSGPVQAGCLPDSRLVAVTVPDPPDLLTLRSAILSVARSQSNVTIIEEDSKNTENEPCLCMLLRFESPRATARFVSLIDGRPPETFIRGKR